MERIKDNSIPGRVDLDLKNCKIDDSTLAIFGRSLMNKCFKFESVDLSFNSITDKGFDYFANCLKNSNCEIKYLSMEGNNLNFISKYEDLLTVYSKGQLDKLDIIVQGRSNQTLKDCTSLTS
jgi:hypothetical protein